MTWRAKLRRLLFFLASPFLFAWWLFCVLLVGLSRVANGINWCVNVLNGLIMALLGLLVLAAVVSTPVVFFGSWALEAQREGHLYDGTLVQILATICGCYVAWIAFACVVWFFNDEPVRVVVEESKG